MTSTAILRETAAAGAIVLAGGRSSRMGQAKATLRFGGVPLIERIVTELSREFDEIVVVAAPESEGQVLPRLPGVLIVRDEREFEGPVGAMARGLDAISHDAAFACACDLPMLDSRVARALIEMLAAYDAVIPEVAGVMHPLHAAYRKRCAPVLERMSASGERRLAAIAERASVRRVAESEYRAMDPRLRSIFNLNTPEDYARALKLAGLAR